MSDKKTIEAETQKRGTIKFFNPGKGFGFIIPESGGDDIFFHHTQMKNGLDNKRTYTNYEKISVTYEMDKGKDGRPCAVNLNFRIAEVRVPKAGAAARSGDVVLGTVLTFDWRARVPFGTIEVDGLSGTVRVDSFHITGAFEDISHLSEGAVLELKLVQSEEGGSWSAKEVAVISYDNQPLAKEA